MSTGVPGEVLFEYTRIGHIVRVTAVDAATGTEITIQTPAGTSTADMQRAALNKLEYVLRKNSDANR